MPPNQPTDPNQTNGPMFGAPFQQPVQPVVVTPPTEPAQPEPGGGGGKTIWIVAGLIGLVLLVILVAGIILAAGSGHKKTPAAAKTDGSSNQAEGPTAATSSSVQLSNDSISQDISSLNDDQDFPADKLSDQALGL